MLKGTRRQEKQMQFSVNQVKTIWERDGGKCIYCGSPAQAVDHVIPQSRGGPTILANGVCVCQKCNHDKRDRLEQDWLTRGIFYLMQQGENMDWVDKF